MKCPHFTPSLRMRCAQAATLLAFALFASCTAMEQKNAFLDAQPREVAAVPPDPNLVFSESFESGLGQWSQVSGSWTTGSPAINGSSLISPSGTSGTPYNLTTTSDIDLSGRSNCELKYDIRFALSATSGVGAQILYAGNIVGEFKDTSGIAAISSSGQFLTRRAILTANTTGKLTILIQVPSGTADVRIDNISVMCNQAPATSVTVMYENLNVSASNWTLSNWTWASTGGFGASGSIQQPYADYRAGFTATGWATFQPVQSLLNRHGCKLDFYYSVNSAGPSSCLYLEINGNKVWSLCNIVIAGNTTRYLTAFEGLSSLTFTFRGDDPDGTYGRGFGGTVDDIRLTCQQ